MTTEALSTVIVFCSVYVLIAFELLNKTIAAVLGVMVLLVFGVVDLRTAAGYIDFETLLLLIGMMGIVAVLKRSGFFAVVSAAIAKWTGGQPLMIMVLFSVATALISAFLDNVTTVLIMVPIIIELTCGMGLDPRIYVIILAMSSNLGGTATLVGDPPNIIIGSKVGLSFNQFVVYLFAPVALSTACVIGYFWVVDRRKFESIDHSLVKLFSVQLLIEKIRLDLLSTKIDRKFLYKSMICLSAALLLFVTQTVTGLSPGVVALTVSMILFVITKVEIESILLDVEWSTLLFFAGLFVLVGAMEQKGVIDWLARNIFLKAGDNPFVLTMLVLWVSGIASGFIDNIPFTITMIPIVQKMLEANPVPHEILWWALSLGACMGGNLTLIGASANIVSAGILKKYGYEITFGEFTRKSAPGTIISLSICSLVLCVYLWVFL